MRSRGRSTAATHCRRGEQIIVSREKTVLPDSSRRPVVGEEMTRRRHGPEEGRDEKTVQQSLERLKEAAGGKENIVPSIIARCGILCHGRRHRQRPCQRFWQMGILVPDPGLRRSGPRRWSPTGRARGASMFLRRNPPKHTLLRTGFGGLSCPHSFTAIGRGLLRRRIRYRGGIFMTKRERPSES